MTVIVVGPCANAMLEHLKGQGIGVGAVGVEHVCLGFLKDEDIKERLDSTVHVFGPLPPHKISRILATGARYFDLVPSDDAEITKDLTAENLAEMKPVVREYTRFSGIMPVGRAIGLDKQ